MANESLPLFNSQKQFTKRGRPRKIGSERDIAVCLRYQAGQGLKLVGLHFSLTPEGVRQILLKNGIQLRPRRRPPSLKPKKHKPTSEEKFWLKIKKTETGCWEWQGPRHANGYGRACVNGRPNWAHRHAFALHNGYWPTKHVLHSCDNPPCINPDHLREGTPADNMRDRDSRGRAGWQKDYEGWKEKLRIAQFKRTDCHKRSLTDDQADEIRRRYLSGESARSLCSEFNCHWSHVINIARGKIYKNRRDGTPMPTYPVSPKVHKLFKRNG